MLITYQQRYVDTTVLLKIECMQLETCNDRLLNGVRVPDIIQRKPQKIEDLGHWKGEQY